MRHNWEALAGAIILRAVVDYRLANLRMNKPRYRKNTMGMIREVENFFRSGWFGTLTKLNGNVLLKQIKEDIAI